MEKNDANFNSLENHSSKNTNNGGNSIGNSDEKEVFVNHAEIAWHDMRRQWIGDHSQRSRRMPREPVMSWTATYEDLLLSTAPFHQRIPLAEMVDFLVDIWHEEGLFD